MTRPRSGAVEGASPRFGGLAQWCEMLNDPDQKIAAYRVVPR